MADLTKHEKFLRGEPLSADLAALRDGLDTAPPPRAAPPARKAYDDPNRPLTRAERLDLKEWFELPGWQLYLRLTERTSLFYQKRAISLSQTDPLNNRDTIAHAWAYSNMARGLAAELEAMVVAEVGALENE